MVQFKWLNIYSWGWMYFYYCAKFHNYSVCISLIIWLTSQIGCLESIISDCFWWESLRNDRKRSECAGEGKVLYHWRNIKNIKQDCVESSNILTSSSWHSRWSSMGQKAESWTTPRYMQKKQLTTCLLHLISFRNKRRVFTKKNLNK